MKILILGGTGVYNAVGLDETTTMGEFLRVCRSVSGSDATFLPHARQVALLAAWHRRAD